jgi:hypothetical protein
MMKFSLVPLLVNGKTIPDEARQALRENRAQDAAKVLMREYGLNCVEAGDLLDVTVCKEGAATKLRGAAETFQA